MSDELESHIQERARTHVCIFLWARIFKVAGPGTAKRLIIALKVKVRNARSSP